MGCNKWTLLTVCISSSSPKTNALAAAAAILIIINNTIVSQAGAKALIWLRGGRSNAIWKQFVMPPGCCRVKSATEEEQIVAYQ